MPGKGRLTLTGKLGDVMQESAQAAVTYARSRADDLGIEAGAFDSCDMHIHVPAGRYPQGRAVGGRDDGDGAGLGAHAAAGAQRHGHDGRDHAAGQGAARRRRSGTRCWRPTAPASSASSCPKRTNLTWKRLLPKSGRR